MSGVNNTSLFVLCASFLGGVVMSYKGMNGTNDSLMLGDGGSP